MAKPKPIIGPISGEMSIAPIMTAVELTLSPNDAMKMAKINTQELTPRKLTLSRICAITTASSSR